MDSAVVLAEARERGFTAYALSFRYGQRHDIERGAADRVARALGGGWRAGDYDFPLPAAYAAPGQARTAE